MCREDSKPCAGDCSRCPAFDDPVPQAVDVPSATVTVPDRSEDTKNATPSAADRSSGRRRRTKRQAAASKLLLDASMLAESAWNFADHADSDGRWARLHVLAIEAMALLVKEVRITEREFHERMIAAQTDSVPVASLIRAS